MWPWSSRQSSRLAATPRHDTIRFPGGVRLQVSDSHVASSLPPSIILGLAHDHSNHQSFSSFATFPAGSRWVTAYPFDHVTLVCVSSCPISYRCWPGGNALGSILTMIPVDRVRSWSMWDTLNLVRHASVLQALSRWPAYSAVDRECLSRDWRGDVSLYVCLSFFFSFLFFVLSCLRKILFLPFKALATLHSFFLLIQLPVPLFYYAECSPTIDLRSCTLP